MSIIVKSGVPGKAPTPLQLSYGQLAINYADEIMYFKNSSNQIIPVNIGSGSGTVTQVALATPTEFVVSGSPVTSNGTLTFTKAPQPANFIWAGPVSGANTEPTFRKLSEEDLAHLNVGTSMSKSFLLMGA